MKKLTAKGSVLRGNQQDDPLELSDLGRDQGTAARAARDDLYGLAFEWMRERRNRVGMNDAAVDRRPSPAAAGGVKIGIW